MELTVKFILLPSGVELTCGTQDILRVILDHYSLDRLVVKPSVLCVVQQLVQPSQSESNKPLWAMGGIPIDTSYSQTVDVVAYLVKRNVPQSELLEIAEKFRRSTEAEGIPQLLNWQGIRRRTL